MTLLAGFGHTDEAGGAVSGVDRGRDPARGDRDDGRGHDRGGRGRRRRGLPGGLRRRADRRARRRRPRRSRTTLARVEAICREHDARRDPRSRPTRRTAYAVWRGRKAAFAAMGRISPDYYVQDGVVPRTKLPRCCARSTSSRASTACASATSSTPATATCIRSCSTTAASRARPSAREELAEAILDACLDAGGSLTGEHGVGIDKACAMPLMFSERDLAALQRLRRAFDPLGLANPGKVLPDAAPVRRGARARTGCTRSRDGLAERF